MAKINTSISVDEKIVEQAKMIAEHERRSFSVLVEIALEQFIKQYGSARHPGLTLLPTETPAKEVAKC